MMPPAGCSGVNCFAPAFHKDSVVWVRTKTAGSLDQRCFLARGAVKSGSFFATQSTNLRIVGLASRPSTSMP